MSSTSQEDGSSAVNGKNDLIAAGQSGSCNNYSQDNISTFYWRCELNLVISYLAMNSLAISYSLCPLVEYKYQ